MLAEIDNKQLALQEVHRFKNGFSRIDGSDRWDRLFLGALACGLGACVPNVCVHPSWFLLASKLPNNKVNIMTAASHAYHSRIQR